MKTFFTTILQANLKIHITILFVLCFFHPVYAAKEERQWDLVRSADKGCTIYSKPYKIKSNINNDIEIEPFFYITKIRQSQYSIGLYCDAYCNSLAEIDITGKKRALNAKVIDYAFTYSKEQDISILNDMIQTTLPVKVKMKDGDNVIIAYYAMENFTSAIKKLSNCN